MVPPFGVSLFADPAGSFTTAAAMVARVERTAEARTAARLKGLAVAVFGATGVVGFASGVIAALEGRGSLWSATTASPASGTQHT